MSMLELDRVGTCLDRGVDELQGHPEFAVVVDPGFGDHKARLPLTNRPAGQFKRRYGWPPVRTHRGWVMLAARSLRTPSRAGSF